MAVRDQLLIRADAGSEMGTGHVMRCLAVAQAWQGAGREAVFLSRCESPALQQRIRTAGFHLELLDSTHPDASDLNVLRSEINRRGGPVVLLDGYQFDAPYQQAVRETGSRLMVIDDSAHLPAYHADILLNQNIHALTLAYNCDADTVRLLGPRYVVLRPEFLAYRGWTRDVPDKARHILVTLGGSDPRNSTLKVIEALRQLGPDRPTTRVIVGPANRHMDALRTATETMESVEILTDVDNMPALMAWADLAVSAAGSTSWELAFMGVPMLLVSVAQNQVAVAESLATEGIARNLGWHESLSGSEISEELRRLVDDVERRKAMSQRGRECIDGLGAQRVVRALAGGGVTLRPARADDCRLLWTWANDSDVRSVSFSPDAIPWERHVEWFEARLRDPNCFLYIACDQDGSPIGQVRFDLDSGAAIISISLSAESRGKGLGTALIERGGEELLQHVPVTTIHAYVKPDNMASVRAFENAGYVVNRDVAVRGRNAIHLEWRRR